MTLPLVSVIVPVFNGERFLAEALASVVSQSYRPIEVVVVDDGSVDGTPDVARLAAGIRYIRQDNAGPAAARNAGIATSTGELVAFLDADDVLPPTKLQIQVDYLRTHPGAACVLGRQELLLEPGVPPPEWTRGQPMLLRPAPDAPPRDSIPPMSMVVRRPVFDTVGLFDDRRFRVGEDVDWLCRAREAGLTVAILDDVVLHRRIHCDNLSGDEDARRRGTFGVLKARINRTRARRQRHDAG